MKYIIFIVLFSTISTTGFSQRPAKFDSLSFFDTYTIEEELRDLAYRDSQKIEIIDSFIVWALDSTMGLYTRQESAYYAVLKGGKKGVLFGIENIALSFPGGRVSGFNTIARKPCFYGLLSRNSTTDVEICFNYLRTHSINAKQAKYIMLFVEHVMWSPEAVSLFLKQHDTGYTTYLENYKLLVEAWKKMNGYKE